MTVGYLVGTTFRTWGRHALFLSLLGVVASLPMAVVSYRMYLDTGLFPDPAVAAQDPFGANPVFVHGREFLLGWLVTVLVWSAASAAAIHAAAQALRGERVQVGAALAAALHRGPYVVAVLLLTTAALVATAVTLVVPCVLVVAWCAAMPSAVLEGTGPIRALARSWGLTRGHRWRLLAGLLIVVLAFGVPVLALQSVGMGIALATGRSDVLGPGRTLAIAMSLYQLVAGTVGMVTPVACAVAHRRLREAKEGGDAATLGGVFE